MANSKLFNTRTATIPASDARNEAGGQAYALTPKEQLAQFVMTGSFTRTFYASAEDQLETVLLLCLDLEPEFVAKTAVYARRNGFMKDTPALLVAYLTTVDGALAERVFPLVIDNGKMLRNFVQIVRSNVLGRRSLGTRPRRMVRNWFADRTPEELFRQSIGANPTIGDVIKMVHPKPADDERAALYRYLIGKPFEIEALPPLVQSYERWKATKEGDVPAVPFELLTSLDLGTAEWTAIGRTMSWQQTRQNLNTLVRHQVFDQPKMAGLVADRLRDGERIARARVFPYQLLVAYLNASDGVPQVVREALQDALELAIANVPTIEGKVYVFPDVSGSMGWPVTGERRGATTKVRCIDVAALVAAAFLRKNTTAEVIPFEQDVVSIDLNPRDTVMTNATKLAATGGGGTNCSAPLEQLNRKKAVGDLVVYVSDNESWVDTGRGRGTATMQEWEQFKRRSPNARMVCIDIQPYKTTQATTRPDVLNIGGFSDAVFSIVADFARDGQRVSKWVEAIEKSEE